jgi:hypothetical protein
LNLDPLQADLAILADAGTATTFEDTGGGNADRTRLLTEMTDAKAGVESVRDGIQVRQALFLTPRFCLKSKETCSLCQDRLGTSIRKALTTREARLKSFFVVLLHPAVARCHDNLRDHGAKNGTAFAMVPFYTKKAIILPRQARDKHRGSSSTHKREMMMRFVVWCRLRRLTLPPCSPSPLASRQLWTLYPSARSSMRWARSPRSCGGSRCGPPAWRRTRPTAATTLRAAPRYDYEIRIHVDMDDMWSPLFVCDDAIIHFLMMDNNRSLCQGRLLGSRNV